MNESLLGPKAEIRMRAWNVRTMYETWTTAQVIRGLIVWVLVNATEQGLNAERPTMDESSYIPALLARMGTNQ